MSAPHLTTTQGHPAFLDLPWDLPLLEWEHERLVELPTGVHRHPVRFVAYPGGIYAVKELRRDLARHEFESLRELADRQANVVEVVGTVDRGWVDGSEEWSGAVITKYLDHAFSYRELITGGSFGHRRNQLLDGFAGLLVELHNLGCYWGDCSLSNVLYRYDAAALAITMVDAETVELHDRLTDGQRAEDVEIMIVNVAGGMADIAAAQGVDIDHADLALGEDVAARYEALWGELAAEIVVGTDEGYRVRERVERLNSMGFEVGEVDLLPDGSGDNRLRLKVEVGGRSYHRHRLSYLTRIDATENQARQILDDLRYYEVKTGGGDSPAGKSLTAIRWRVGVFEPMLERIGAEIGEDDDPVQAYCDFLHHRYVMSHGSGRDVPDDEAFADWLARGKPGYELT